MTRSSVLRKTASLSESVPQQLNRYAVAVFLSVVILALCGGLTAQSAPSSLGQWTKATKWPQTAGHASLLPNGKVLFWGPPATPQIYDPVAKTFIAASPAPYDIFCSGHAFLPDGRLLVAGGYKGNKIGLPNAAIYDSGADSWTKLPDMLAGRFLPTATTLSNGDVLVTGGYNNQFVGPNRSLQVWQLGSLNKWRYLNGATLGLPVDPWMVAAPADMVFDAGPYPATRLLNPSGVGHWGAPINTKYDAPRDYGTAVSYAAGKVLIVGGADDPPTATAETIDLNDANPAWSFTNPMANPRQQPNVTILPDGTVLVTGGSTGSGFNNSKSPALTPELWNPNTGAWTTLASSTVYRGYDSTALLLPDGRVLTAGGSNASGELFSPPYLFNGARPTITSAPAQVNFGQTFTVTSSQAASITNINWVSLSSVTHGFNAGQHFNQLSFTHVSGGLQVTAPSDPGNAAPGVYMLFILNGKGVPSVASMVRVTAAAPGVTSVGPSSGSTNGATPVTISGTNFLRGATVQIGGVMATNVQVTNSTTITAMTPAHSPKVADVTVTNPDYQASTLSGAYTYTLGSGIAFVQVAFRTAAHTNAISSPFPLPQREGDLNIAVVGWNDVTSTITSVTDSSGNSYALAAPLVTGTKLRQAIYYAKNIAAAHANTVTVKFDQRASFVDVRILEYAGLDKVNPLDASNGSSGTGFTAKSGPLTTTTATDLVLGADTVSYHTLSPGPGYTPIVSTRYYNIAEHLITSKQGTFNPSANLAGPPPFWVMQGVAFKAAGQ